MKRTVMTKGEPGILATIFGCIIGAFLIVFLVPSMMLATTSVFIPGDWPLSYSAGIEACRDFARPLAPWGYLLGFIFNCVAIGCGFYGLAELLGLRKPKTGPAAELPELPWLYMASGFGGFIAAHLVAYLLWTILAK